MQMRARWMRVTAGLGLLAVFATGPQALGAPGERRVNDHVVDKGDSDGTESGPERPAQPSDPPGIEQPEPRPAPPPLVCDTAGTCRFRDVPLPSQILWPKGGPHEAELEKYFRLYRAAPDAARRDAVQEKALEWVEKGNPKCLTVTAVSNALRDACRKDKSMTARALRAAEETDLAMAPSPEHVLTEPPSMLSRYLAFVAKSSPAIAEAERLHLEGGHSWPVVTILLDGMGYRNLKGQPFAEQTLKNAAARYKSRFRDLLRQEDHQ